VATSAFVCEEFFPLAGVACQLIAKIAVAIPVTASICGEFHLQVNVLSNFKQLAVFKVGECGHAALRSACLDNWSNGFSFLIVKHQRRANQTGTLCAARILSMTGCAIVLIKRFSEFCGGYVGRGSESQKLSHICSGSAGHLVVYSGLLRHSYKSSKSAAEDQAA
jgi:hypothetical protein